MWFLFFVIVLILGLIFKYGAAAFGKTSLKNKQILITGCDTGFGNRTAIKLAEQGAIIYAGCLTEDGIGSLKRIGSSNLRPFLMNVTSEKSVEDAVKLIRADTDSLWAIVNNAGIAGVTAPFDWVNVADFIKVVDVNLIGTARVTKAFLPFLKKCKNSRIINIASIAGRLPMEYNVAYCASKYGVEGFSVALRQELNHLGISVVLIEPFFMKTPLVQTIFQHTKNAFKSLPLSVQEEYSEDYLDGILKLEEDVHKISEDPEQVVDAIRENIERNRPDSHCLVGKGSVIVYLAQILPGKLLDALLALQSPQIKMKKQFK